MTDGPPAPILVAGAGRGYGPATNRPKGSGMNRRLALFFGLAGLTLILSACDKCGGFEEIRAPGQPHACRDAAAR